MDMALFWENVIPLVVMVTAVTLFLRRALPLRRERPEMLKNGLWFLLPFIVGGPLTYLFGLFLLPVCLIVVVVISLAPRLKRGPIFWLSLGELVSGVLIFSYLGVINTYFEH